MTLTSGPLTLVSADPALAEALVEYYCRNRDFLRAFEPTREESFFTAAHQRSLLEQAAREETQKSGYRFYIFHEAAPELIIGTVGFSNVVWGAFRSAFLGYKLDLAYLNRGYMTRSVALVTEYAFKTLGLHRIEANVMPKNKQSLRVLEKNGYEPEGISKHYLNINGIWEDHIHMVRLNEEKDEAPWEGEL